MAEAWAWLLTLLGVGLVLVALLEVFFAVLHQDIGGIVAPKLHRAIWNLALALSRRIGRRRALLALAGPVMMATTFAVWVGLFVLGFALLYWPRLGQFRAEDELGALGFVDAFYFSGVTGTVLGYGDLTPLTPGLKGLAFAQSGLGFALLTGVVTYLISVVSGVAERNAVALRVLAASERTADGVHLVRRCLRFEEVSDLRSRLHTLSETLLTMHQKMHLFPILDLYYRSHDPALDPEPMLKTVTEAAIAGHVLAQSEGGRPLGAVAHDLGEVASEIMGLVASQHLDEATVRGLEQPAPQEQDRAFVREVRARLGLHAEGEGAGSEGAGSEGDDAAALALAFRLRLFLAALERLTDWRADARALRP